MESIQTINEKRERNMYSHIKNCSREIKGMSPNVAVSRKREIDTTRNDFPVFARGYEVNHTSDMSVNHEVAGGVRTEINDYYSDDENYFSVTPRVNVIGKNLNKWDVSVFDFREREIDSMDICIAIGNVHITLDQKSLESLISRLPENLLQ
jgi:hypothetical protein